MMFSPIIIDPSNHCQSFSCIALYNEFLNLAPYYATAQKFTILNIPPYKLKQILENRKPTYTPNAQALNKNKALLVKIFTKSSRKIEQMAEYQQHDTVPLQNRQGRRG
jgi:hypothetical protein